LWVRQVGEPAATAWIFERGNTQRAELVKQRVECGLGGWPIPTLIQFAPNTIERSVVAEQLTKPCEPLRLYLHYKESASASGVILARCITPTRIRPTIRLGMRRDSADYFSNKPVVGSTVYDWKDVFLLVEVRRALTLAVLLIVTATIRLIHPDFRVRRGSTGLLDHAAS
jgi:hypothetical protein